jgi:subtilisin family serine protease
LSLNTGYAFLSLKEPKIPEDILSRNIVYTDFKSDNVHTKKYQGNKGVSRFWTVLTFEEKLTEEQYLTLLSDIKQNNNDVIISPYFNAKGIIGLSNFFYVKLKKESDTVLLRQIAVQNECIIIEQDVFMPLWFVLSTSELSNLNALECCNVFYESDLFQAVEPDLMFSNWLQHINNPYFDQLPFFPNKEQNSRTVCANDSLFAYQWNVESTEQEFIAYKYNESGEIDTLIYHADAEINIKACEAWQLSSGSNVTVTIFDTGVDPMHSDLKDNIHPFNYDCDTGGGSSVGGHGTLVGGIVGAAKDNEIGIAGVAPECKLMSISYHFGHDPLGNQKLATGIMLAWQNGASIISNSWYTDTLHSLVLSEAIDSAIIRGRNGLGCVVVFASGNDGDSTVYFPAKLSSVIAVGAISLFGERKSFSFYDIGEWSSTYGSDLDIVAPGVFIPSTAPYCPWCVDYILEFCGTSSACPHVSGVAALILSVNPNLTGQEVRNIIESTAQKIKTDLYDYEITPNRPNGTWHEEMGYGLVDAHAAVLAALETRCNNGLPVVYGTISQNTTWNTPHRALGNIIIPSDITLNIMDTITLLSHVSILIHPGGKLVIDGGTLTNACEGEMWQGITVLGDHTMPMLPEYQGYLELKNGVTIENAEAGVIVKGGIFIIEDNTTFQNLEGGIVLENALSESKPWFYDNDIEYDLNNITFNNTPLIHHGTRLNISNCTFNRSNVRTSLSVSNIDNCIFYECLFESSYANKTGKLLPTTVSNCNFTGNFNCPNVPKTYSALQLNDSYRLQLYNNSINGYPTGIKLNSSGATIAYYYGCKTVSAIHDNEITNCIRGIQLYNSIVNIVNNNIYDNTNGVQLYNNSSTSFYGWGEPTLRPQNIKDNTYYELYASSNSFPAIFRFNNVIDEDNLGNSFDDPMIYWDLDNSDRFPSSMLRDVTYNCWGVNFDPLEDFYPPKYYSYDPIVCLGKSTITPAEDEQLFLIGLDYFANEDFTNAEITFLDVIENYPKSNFAIAAMHELFSLERILDNDFYRLQNYFASFTPEDSTLFDVADFLTTRCNVMERDWQPAINWYEYRIENPPSYPDSVFAVIDLGNIHLMMEEDTIGGAKSSGRFYYRLANIKPKSKEHFDENKATLLATLPQKSKTENTQTSNSFVGKKGALGQNIPNPTAGTTTISYEIYTEGAVEINIYNLTGQLVKKMPQGTRQQGTYQATISVSGTPIGMYHYLLLINGERVDAKKLVVN